MIHQLRLFAICFFLTSNAWAFVQNVTHGYPACVACHVSPNGGALLTDYGRSLSKELMSTWGVSDSFAQPYFGIKNRENVKIGGDLRGIQTHVENNNIETGKLFLMERNVEVGVQQGNLMLVATAGTQEGPEGSPRRGQFISQRHYALWSPAPTSKVRIGKFRQSFGINTPNHTRLIKNRFGFGSLSEAYNLEFTQFYESYEVTMGASLGRIDNPRTASSEQSLSANYTYYRNENSRIGASLLMGESSVQRRTLTALHAVAPLSEHWLIMSELDYQRSHLTSFPQQGIDSIASLLRVGNTLFKGFMWYGLFEHLSVDNGSTYNLTTQPGIGIQWLPIPHFNIQLEYARQTDHSNTGNPTDVAFIMLHTYL